MCSPTLWLITSSKSLREAQPFLLVDMVRMLSGHLATEGGMIQFVLELTNSHRFCIYIYKKIEGLEAFLIHLRFID